MNKDKIITEAEKWMQTHFENETTGHDWAHINRVHKLSKRIQVTEGGDLFAMELAALFHDYSDAKLTRNPAQASNGLVIWMKQQEIPPNLITQIIRIIESVSFKQGNNPIQA